MMRGYWRRLILGLLTLIGFSERGFFIPYRYAGTKLIIYKNAFLGLTEQFIKSEPTFIDFLKKINESCNQIKLTDKRFSPTPRWDQDWFPGLDAASAYTMVCKYRPKRIVEIGCGHSTRFFISAILDAGLDTKLTAIDPKPRANIDQLGVECLRVTVQEILHDSINKSCFSELGRGDILSIDSSHILMPGTDVDCLLNRVVPLLPKGILIHIHDIFLPDHYPKEWTWRGYNEQLGVAPLLEGDHYNLIWSSHYVRSRMAADIKKFRHVRELPLIKGAMESSLWIEKEQ